jgi:hypothetical protein
MEILDQSTYAVRIAIMISVQSVMLFAKLVRAGMICF